MCILKAGPSFSGPQIHELLQYIMAGFPCETDKAVKLKQKHIFHWEDLAPNLAFEWRNKQS